MQGSVRMTIAAAIGIGGTLFSAPSFAQTLGAPYSGDYTLNDLGSVSGVPTNYGGLTFLNNSTLLLGGAANGGSGGIYEMSVTRNLAGHITGFGSPTLYATSPFIDGGLEFGYGGDLFATGYPNNTLLEYKPGSTSPDKTISLTGSGIFNSVGTLAFIPGGFVNAGGMVIASYNGGGWYDVSLTPDGTGTYDIGSVGSPVAIGGGPEGIVYVSPANADFSTNSVLVSDYSTGNVEAYQLDGSGDPIAGTAQTFISGLSGAEGGTIDPLTGDFLFSTFGGGNKIIDVSGFVAPPPPSNGTPEPGAVAMLAGFGITAGIALRRRRATAR